MSHIVKPSGVSWDFQMADAGGIEDILGPNGTQTRMARYATGSSGNIVGLAGAGGDTYPVQTTRLSSLNFPGIPVITFNNGLSDINATYSAAGSGGEYVVDTAVTGKYATTPIKLVPGPSAATTRITMDLSATQTSNLKQFYWDHESVFGLLVYVDNPAALTSVVLWLTVQSNRLVDRYNGTASMVFGTTSRPGWYMLLLTGDRYGFADTTGAYQQGLVPNVTGGTNLVIGSTATPVDSVRIDVTSASADSVGTSKVVVDSLWLMPRTRPALALVFDDGYISQYTEGAEYLANQNVVGTLACTATLIDTTGYMTTAQVQKLYDAGWDIVNHANTHFNANQKSTNSICLSQSPGAGGSLTLNGSVGSSTFDAPRCLTFTPAGNETGRPITIVGLDENGAAQTNTIYGRNAAVTITETVWTKVTSISYTGTMAGAVTVGTTYSYAEILSEFSTCKAYLQAQGWTRGLDCAVYPNGASNILVDRVMAALGITFARTVSSTVRPVYPFVSGFNALQVPGFGGGGSSQTATGVGVVGKYNTGNGTISTPTFPSASYFPQLPRYVDWTVTMTAATTFEVSTTQENEWIGTGSTGVAFTAQGVSFTITVGGTPMVAGDQFRVFVTNPLLIVEKEIVNKCGFGTLYFHDIIRTGAVSSVQMLRSDYRMTIDEIVKDARAGKVDLMTLSEMSRAAY